MIAPSEADRWALDVGDVLNWLESAAAAAGVVLGAHLPALFPERRETVAGECLGCQTQFAVDVRLPLPAAYPDCGADLLARVDVEGSGPGQTGSGGRKP